MDANWSPDAGKIIFGGNSGNAAGSIRILDTATRQVSTVPGSQGMFSPRWSPDGRYIAALNYSLTQLLLFDFQTQKWTEMAKGSVGWPWFSKDGQYLYFQDSSGTGALMRVRMSDRTIEKAVDLKSFITVGFYGGWFTAAPDGSPIMLRNAGTIDVYALDFEEP
jgi:Tol biopolymer transport system component